MTKSAPPADKLFHRAATAKKLQNRAIPSPAPGTAEGITEVRRQETLLKTAALQDAILNSANFSSIATDARGVIQIFNVGAERMLGYAAADVMNKTTPADISDPQEVIARAKALSVELSTPITPGFEALVFKVPLSTCQFPVGTSLDGYRPAPARETTPQFCGS